MLGFVDLFAFPFVFVFHRMLFPTKNYALSRNDYYILITKDLLFAFQMIIIFMVFYSKLAFLVAIYVCFFHIIRNTIFLFISKSQPHLLLVTPKNRKPLNLIGVKLEFLLDTEEDLNFELFEKVMSFERFDAIILNNISPKSRELICKTFQKRIKIFNYS